MTNCTICNNEIKDADMKCSRCNFPLTASYEQRLEFLGSIELKRKKLRKAESKIDNAGYLLYALAGLTFLGIVLNLMIKSPINKYIIQNIIIVILYAICGYFTNSFPLLATICALLTFIGVIIINYFIEPDSVLYEIPFKIFVFIVLVTGIYFSVTGKKQQKELNKKYNWISNKN